MTDPLITVGVNWSQIGYVSSAILVTVIAVLLGFIKFLLREIKENQNYERKRNALLIQIANEFLDAQRAMERYFRESGK